ncbi:MAG: hypothetical protein M1827_007276 [Pycnora praestabilis]|nr:MAG: hypothetical protein M1827_007276 [Pycnora praestabilis]
MSNEGGVTSWKGFTFTNVFALDYERLLRSGLPPSCASYLDQASTDENSMRHWLSKQLFSLEEDFRTASNSLHQKTETLQTSAGLGEIVASAILRRIPFGIFAGASSFDDEAATRTPVSITDTRRSTTAVNMRIEPQKAVVRYAQSKAVHIKSSMDTIFRIPDFVGLLIEPPVISIGANRMQLAAFSAGKKVVNGNSISRSIVVPLRPTTTNLLQSLGAKMYAEPNECRSGFPIMESLITLPPTAAAFDQASLRSMTKAPSDMLAVSSERAIVSYQKRMGEGLTIDLPIIKGIIRSIFVTNESGIAPEHGLGDPAAWFSQSLNASGEIVALSSLHEGDQDSSTFEEWAAQQGADMIVHRRPIGRMYNPWEEESNLSVDQDPATRQWVDDLVDGEEQYTDLYADPFASVAEGHSGPYQYVDWPLPEGSKFEELEDSGLENMIDVVINDFGHVEEGIEDAPPRSTLVRGSAPWISSDGSPSTTLRMIPPKSDVHKSRDTNMTPIIPSKSSSSSLVRSPPLKDNRSRALFASPRKAGSPRRRTRSPMKAILANAQFRIHEDETVGSSRSVSLGNTPEKKGPLMEKVMNYTEGLPDPVENAPVLEAPDQIMNDDYNLCVKSFDRESPIDTIIRNRTDQLPDPFQIMDTIGDSITFPPIAEKLHKSVPAFVEDRRDPTLPHNRPTIIAEAPEFDYTGLNPQVRSTSPPVTEESHAYLEDRRVPNQPQDRPKTAAEAPEFDHSGINPRIRITSLSMVEELQETVSELNEDRPDPTLPQNRPNHVAEAPEFNYSELNTQKTLLFSPSAFEDTSLDDISREWQDDNGPLVTEDFDATFTSLDSGPELSEASTTIDEGKANHGPFTPARDPERAPHFEMALAALEGRTAKPEAVTLERFIGQDYGQDVLLDDLGPVLKYPQPVKASENMEVCKLIYESSRAYEISDWYNSENMRSDFDFMGSSGPIDVLTSDSQMDSRQWPRVAGNQNAGSDHDFGGSESQYRFVFGAPTTGAHAKGFLQTMLDPVITEIGATRGNATEDDTARGWSRAFRGPINHKTASSALEPIITPQGISSTQLSETPRNDTSDNAEKRSLDSTSARKDPEDEKRRQKQRQRRVKRRQEKQRRKQREKRSKH